MQKINGNRNGIPIANRWILAILLVSARDNAKTKHEALNTKEQIMPRLECQVVGLESQQRRVYAEDGAYDAFEGYRVVARVYTDGGSRVTYYYHELVSRDEELLLGLADAVRAAGSLDPDRWEERYSEDVLSADELAEAEYYRADFERRNFAY